MMIKTNSISSEVSLAEFYVVGYRQRRVLEVLTSGNYSRLCADILFSRQEYLVTYKLSPGWSIYAAMRIRTH